MFFFFLKTGAHKQDHTVVR